MMQSLFKAKKWGPRIWLMAFTTEVSFLAMMGAILDEDQPECDSKHFTEAL